MLAAAACACSSGVGTGDADLDASGTPDAPDAGELDADGVPSDASMDAPFDASAMCPPDASDWPQPEFYPHPFRIQACGPDFVRTSPLDECIVLPCEGPFRPSGLPKPECVSIYPECHFWNIDLIFDMYAQVRLRDGRLVSRCGVDLTPVAEVFARHPEACVAWRTTFEPNTEAEDDQSWQMYVCESRAELMNANDHFNIDLPLHYPAPMALELVNDLNRLDVVRVVGLGCGDLEP